jgi:hypothetical protein
MRTDVEPAALELDGAGEAADTIQSLDHGGARAVADSLQRRGHTRRAAADDHQVTGRCHSSSPA